MLFLYITHHPQKPTKNQNIKDWVKLTFPELINSTVCLTKFIKIGKMSAVTPWAVVPKTFLLSTWKNTHKQISIKPVKHLKFDETERKFTSCRHVDTKRKKLNIKKRCHKVYRWALHNNNNDEPEVVSLWHPSGKLWLCWSGRPRHHTTHVTRHLSRKRWWRHWNNLQITLEIAHKLTSFQNIML